MWGIFFTILLSTTSHADIKLDICEADQTAVSSEKYPAVIQIETNKGKCSATIVGPNVIITAAHCVYEETGFFNYNNKQYTFTFLPSSYDEKEIRLDHIPDVSLGLVHTQIEDAIPISLSFEKPIDPLMVLGYGRGPLSEYIAKTEKETELKRYLISNDSTNRYSCPGDSGGPTLARNLNGQLELVGIHSSTDLYRDTKDIRTNSEAFKKFIKEKASENNLSICGFNLVCP